MTATRLRIAFRILTNAVGLVGEGGMKPQVLCLFLRQKGVCPFVFLSLSRAIKANMHGRSCFLGECVCFWQKFCNFVHKYWCNGVFYFAPLHY